MPYTINMPQANQRINDTQPLIRDNFNEINADFQRNHVSMLAALAGDRGKHTFVKFVNVGAGPTAVPGSTEKWVYNLIYNGQPELFVQTSTAAPATAIPMTASDTVGTEGWTYLPSGLLIKYGRFNNTGVAHNFIGPAFAATPYLTATCFPAVGFDPFIVIINTLTNLQFTLITYRLLVAPPPPIACQVEYIAIGR